MSLLAWKLARRQWLMRAGMLFSSAALPFRLSTAAEKSVSMINAVPRLALVIGNTRYSQAPLKNPVNDAKGIAGELQKIGFEVNLRLDAGRREMIDAFQSFSAALGSKKAVGIFYYAGHGAQLAWKNYLIPVDAEIEKLEDLQSKTVELNSLLQGLVKAKNPMNVIILDACRDNPFGRKLPNNQKGLSQFDAPPGSLLAYATAPGNVAADGEGINGLYTENLLRELKVPEAKIEDVFKRVRLAVRRKSEGRQIPWESTSLEEDFYFIPPAQQKKLSAEESEQLFEEQLAGWEKIKISKDGVLFEEYIRKYPSGNFSELAQFRLDRLLVEIEKTTVETEKRKELLFAEENRIALEKRLADEQKNIEEKRLAEESRLLGERKTAELERQKKLQMAEVNRLELEKRIAEERRLEAEKRISDEKRIALLSEEKRIAEDNRLSLARKAAEAERQKELQLADEKRLAFEKRLVEERRIAEEKRLGAERKAQEESRLAGERAAIGAHAEKATPIQSVALSVNPYSVGTAKSDGAYQVGDIYRYRTLDTLTRQETGRFVRRVTGVTDFEVIYNDGRIVEDLFGNLIKGADETTFTERQIFLPEYSIGKKWKTRYRYATQKGREGGVEASFKVVAREMIETLGGSFQAFKVEGEGFADAGASFRWTYWVAPERVRRVIVMEFITRNRGGRFVVTRRDELVDYKQKA